MTSASTTDAPVVFVSHATEDQERFVTNFATKLRSVGVNAWYSKWEMQPGDRLVEKIQDGIEDCAAFIVVLSEFSINKPWVVEEIDAALIRSIEAKTKIISVVLDRVKVPLLLSSRVWEPVNDIASYEESLDNIVDAVFNREYRHKPPLGRPPAYTQRPVGRIPGLEPNDALVLQAACELLIDGNTLPGPEELIAHPTLQGMPPRVMLASLSVLDGAYLEVGSVMSSEWDGVHSVTVTTYGFNAYADACLPDYQTMKARVASRLLHVRAADSAEVASELGVDHTTVGMIFRKFENDGFLQLSDTIGEPEEAYRIQAEKLRRAMDAGRL